MASEDDLVKFYAGNGDVAVVLPRKVFQDESGRLEKVLEGIHEWLRAHLPPGTNFIVWDKIITDDAGRGKKVWLGVFDTEEHALMFKLKFSDGV